MAFNPIIGKDFTVLADASIMAFAESFEYSMDKKEIDVTNLSSAGWDEYVLGSKGWTASMNALMVRTTDTSRGFDYLLNAYLTSDASMVVAFKPTVTGNNYVTGSALLTGLKISNGGVNDKVTYSATWRGTGPLSKLTV
jgi:hypothetical protein